MAEEEEGDKDGAREGNQRGNHIVAFGDVEVAEEATSVRNVRSGWSSVSDEEHIVGRVHDFVVLVVGKNFNIVFPTGEAVAAERQSEMLRAGGKVFLVFVAEINRFVRNLVAV